MIYASLYSLWSVFLVRLPEKSYACDDIQNVICLLFEKYVIGMIMKASRRCTVEWIE